MSDQNDSLFKEERFNERDPLVLGRAETVCASIVEWHGKPCVNIRDSLWTVEHARALRDWLNEALPS